MHFSNVCIRCISWMMARSYVTSLHHSPLDRITVPQKMAEKMRKLQMRNELGANKKENKLKSPLIIFCKRNEHNHHKGQSYSDFNPKNLASHGWKHHKSSGDYFTIMAHNKNPALYHEVTDHTRTFSDINLDASLLPCLSHMNVTTPTRIQASTIPKILKGNNVICAAETGSGKTLAYLLPLITLINQWIKIRQTTDTNSPTVIILTPSRELADQIMTVTEKLSEYCAFKSHCVCGGRRTQLKLKFPDKKEMDILIATPGILKKLVNRKIISCSRLQHIVLDEADTLLDDSFSRDIMYLLRKFKIEAGKPSADELYVNTGTQLILVSATLPRGLEEIIGSIIPLQYFQRVTTNYLHHLLPHVSQKFIRAKPSEKPEIVLKLAQKSVNGRLPTMMFCNSNRTSFWLHSFLEQNGIPSLLINGDMVEKNRSGNFESFQNGESDILVCTDIGSRGLDTTRLHMVLNYDFPSFISDYIHRAGRAGRVGCTRPGNVISLIAKRFEVDLLWKIEAAARKMTALPNVNANIKRKLEGLHTNVV